MPSGSTRRDHAYVTTIAVEVFREHLARGALQATDSRFGDGTGWKLSGVAMDDPLDVRTTGDLRVTCQIIRVDRHDDATVIDLVTVDPCWQGHAELPAGTPLTLGFRITHLRDERRELERIMDGWETGDAVLVLEAAGVGQGIGYQFCDGQQHVVMVLEEPTPA